MSREPPSTTLRSWLFHHGPSGLKESNYPRQALPHWGAAGRSRRMRTVPRLFRRRLFIDHRVEDVGVVKIQGSQLFVLRSSRFLITGHQIVNSQIVVRALVVRLEAYGLFMSGDRFFPLAQVAVSDSQIVLGGRPVRFQLNRLLKRGQGVLQLFQPVVGDSDIEMTLRQIRL